MRKLLFTFALCLISTSLCRAQLLWSISKDGIPTSYLFGSCHCASLEICKHIDAFYPSFAKCSQLYGEFSYFENTFQTIDVPMIMPNGQYLDTLFSVDDYKTIESYVSEVLGTCPGKINFTPTGLFFFLSNNLIQNNIPGAAAEEMDFALQKLALSQGKIVMGLSSNEEHFSARKLLFTSDLKEQADDFLQFIKNSKFKPSAYIEYIRKFFNAYMSQDLVSIEKYVNSLGQIEREEAIVIKRNRAWIEIIKKEINHTPTFFVVGAGHLIGDDGLITLLRAEGYTLTPFK